MASSAFCSFFALAAKTDFYSRLASTKIKASGVFWPFLAKIDAFGDKPEGIDYAHRQFNIIDVYCVGYTSPQSLMLNWEVPVMPGIKQKSKNSVQENLYHDMITHRYHITSYPLQVLPRMNDASLECCDIL